MKTYPNETHPDQMVPERLEYAYDRVGNVTILADWGPGSKRGHQLFTYDALGRLTSTQPDPNWPASTNYNGTYAYDAIGNLTAKHEWGPSDADVTRTIAYGNASHVHAPLAVTTNGTTDSYSYDANGNLTNRVGQTLVYDAENRLVRVRNAANGATILRVIYDGDGQRILTVDSTGTRVTLDKLYEKNLTSGDETLFVYAGSRLIATKKNGIVSTVHPDHLGGIALTMQGGTVVADLAFYPFGASRNTSYGTATSDRGFTGQSFNQATGLMHFTDGKSAGRWYDPTIGRWLSPDPNCQLATGSAISCLDLGKEKGRQALANGLVVNPELLNRYAYVANNPTTSLDPDGHLAWFAVMAIGGIGGAAISVAPILMEPGVLSKPDTGSRLAQAALEGAAAGSIGAGAGLATGAGAAYVVASKVVQGAIGGFVSSEAANSIMNVAEKGLPHVGDNFAAAGATGIFLGGVGAKFAAMDFEPARLRGAPYLVVGGFNKFLMQTARPTIAELEQATGEIYQDALSVVFAIGLNKIQQEQSGLVPLDPNKPASWEPAADQ